MKAVRSLIAVSVLFLSGVAAAGYSEYHRCLNAGGYHEDCKHHLK